MKKLLTFQVQFFASVGGVDANMLIKNIMMSNISDDVLVNFSYQGRKKPKSAFNLLRINNCIHSKYESFIHEFDHRINDLDLCSGATTQIFPSTTKQEIIAVISGYLDQTSVRLKKGDK